MPISRTPLSPSRSRTSSAVGPEPPHEPGREPAADRRDLLREQAGDLTQREPHDSAESAEADLPGLQPEAVDLDDDAVGELEEVRTVAERGRGRLGAVPGVEWRAAGGRRRRRRPPQGDPGLRRGGRRGDAQYPDHVRPREG